MSFYRSLAVLCIASLLTGLGLCLLQSAFTPVTGSSAYAALITPASVPDAQVRILLSDSGLGIKNFSDTLISESSQWVLLDDFSGLKQIPLCEYNERVLPLDPRNDGYASRLHSFFVRGDRRLFFISLHSVSMGRLQKRAAKLLEAVPFSLEFIGSSGVPGFFFLIFGAAAGVLFLFRFLPFRPRMEFTEIFFCLPVAVPLVFYGVNGFVLAGLLIGMAALLKEPLAELIPLLRNRRRTALITDRDFVSRLKRDIYGFFKLNWLLALVFLLGFFILSFFLNISFLLSTGVWLLFTAAFGFSVRTWPLRGETRNHIRFQPVLMMKPSLNSLLLGAMLPFFLAAGVAALPVSAQPAAPKTQDSAELFSLQEEPIGEDEYWAHAAFQTSFSYRPLGSNSEPDESYPGFTLAPDNLLDPLPGERLLLPEAPPFPLKNLMDYLTIIRGDKNPKKE